jgi:glutamate-ammonia-ligase adenylyltransferase
LGGKAVLWELFSSNVSTMKLYVRLCAACDYLCDLLVRNPGMVDGLMDSLILQNLPSSEFLEATLSELSEGAEDFEPIVHSFRDAQHLRVGTRDVLGQDDLIHTHGALADIAEVCLSKIVARERQSLQMRHGVPRLNDGSESELMILALGKMGGREPNYHSDLDLVFVYASEGNALTCGGRDPTSHQDYFSRLAAGISRRVSHAGRWGKLYEVDCRLRPTGKSGSLAVSAAELTRYFVSGQGQLWERLALCKARPICSSEEVARFSRSLIASLITSHPWEPQHAAEIAEMRFRMESGATPHNIKRGEGGTVDIEFAIQMLQLRFARTFPAILVPNTIEAASALHACGCLSVDDFEFLTRSYQMLRWVEARLRLMDFSARHDLPVEGPELAKLAYLLDYRHPDELLRETRLLREENRRRFLRLVDACGH